LISSFKDRRTELLAQDKRVKEFDQISVSAKRRLALLDSVVSLEALALVGGNRLEKLKGDRKGQHSIRINDQWRICFVWNDTETCAEQVEIVDYH